MPQPTAILFDAGNTLVWMDHAFLVELLAEHGVATTAEALMEAEYGAKLLLDEMARDAGGDPRARGKAFFGAIFRGIGVAEDAFAPLAERLFARHAERNLWSGVRERTAEALEALREAGYRLGVVSNADGSIEALLESVGLRSHFELVVDSGAVGLEKPDPAIFHHALERMGVAPADAVYVGDIYEIDVAGARAAGMRAILLDPLERWGGLDCERVRELGDLPALLAG